MIGVYTKTYSKNEVRTDYFKRYHDSIQTKTGPFIWHIFDDASADPKMNMFLDMIDGKVAFLERNKINLGVSLQTKKVFQRMIERALIDSRMHFFFHSDSDYVFSPKWAENLIGAVDSNSPVVLTPFRREDGNEAKIEDFGPYVKVKSFIGGAVMFTRAALFSLYRNWDKVERCFSYPDWDYKLSIEVEKIGLPILATQKSLVQHIGLEGENTPFQTTNFVGE